MHLIVLNCGLFFLISHNSSQLSVITKSWGPVIFVLVLHRHNDGQFEECQREPENSSAEYRLGTIT